MKTIEDLKRLREQVESKTKLRHTTGTRIIVGMGTCGIAAGAREVMSAILAEIARRNLEDVAITQTGCIGMCEQEVLVDVVRPGEPRVTYGRVTPSDVAKIIAQHVVNGRIVEELAVGKID
ncbi:MAG: (2Fe-2S) ferredoxin domain-containing protein [Veillonellaceae bacterium]|nr:(2Fe-2S) ferredoxin domain-containing protein [Veillonellaceae bacterium]